MRRNEEDYSQLDDMDRKILMFIFQAIHHPTRKDIEAFFFPNLRPGTKTSYLNRKLVFLKEHEYINYHNLILEDRGKSERGYYLLARGARSIGVVLKRQHYREQKKGFYEARKAKTNITALAHFNKWHIHAKEDVCRRILSKHIQEVIYTEHKVKPLDIDIKSSLPSQIKPDLVLETSKGLIICIIANPIGERQYFTRRKEKYSNCKQFFRFVVITVSQRQWISAVRALRGECSYLGEMEERSIPKLTRPEIRERKFLILKLEEIEKIPSLL